MEAKKPIKPCIGDVVPFEQTPDWGVAMFLSPRTSVFQKLGPNRIMMCRHDPTDECWIGLGEISGPFEQKGLVVIIDLLSGAIDYLPYSHEELHELPDPDNSTGEDEHEAGEEARKCG
jgi:hypothetical protein